MYVPNSQELQQSREHNHPWHLYASCCRVIELYSSAVGYLFIPNPFSMIVLWLFFFFCFSVLLLFLGRRITYWLYSRRMDGRMNEWKKATLPQSPYSGWRCNWSETWNWRICILISCTQSVSRSAFDRELQNSSIFYYLLSIYERTSTPGATSLPPSHK